MAIFNLEDQFVNYGSYHNNKWNRAIHFIFVPLIVMSILTFAARVQVDIPLVSEQMPKDNLFVASNLGLALLLGIIPYYITLDAITGMVLWFIFTALWMAANFIFTVYGPEQSRNIAIIIQIVGWGFQFFGHAAFEGRRPALFDNLFQALIAPFFLALEALFEFGYKPDVYKRAQNRIGKNIAEFRGIKTGKAAKKAE